MTIYLMQGDDNGTADEIEEKLKSAISDLRRVSSLEDIDEIAIDGVERSAVVLITAPEIANVPDLIDVVSRRPRNIFFIVIGSDISARDYKRLVHLGNADWVPEAGLPQEILEIVRRVRAPARSDPAVELPVVVSFVPSTRGQFAIDACDRNRHPSCEG